MVGYDFVIRLYGSASGNVEEIETAGSMMEEMADRHRQLEANWARLRREYADASLHPSVQKKRGLDTRAQQLVLHELYETIMEMDHIALRFCGAEIGGTVQLLGERHKGALAEIENIEIASWYGLRFTKLGERPRIKVISPKDPRRHRRILISGHLWQLLE